MNEWITNINKILMKDWSPFIIISYQLNIWINKFKGLVII